MVRHFNPRHLHAYSLIYSSFESSWIELSNELLKVVIAPLHFYLVVVRLWNGNDHIMVNQYTRPLIYLTWSWTLWANSQTFFIHSLFFSFFFLLFFFFQVQLTYLAEKILDSGDPRTILKLIAERFRYLMMYGNGHQNYWASEASALSIHGWDFRYILYIYLITRVRVLLVKIFSTPWNIPQYSTMTSVINCLI